jgi:hypothetical protein
MSHRTSHLQQAAVMVVEAAAMVAAQAVAMPVVAADTLAVAIAVVMTVATVLATAAVIVALAAAMRVAVTVEMPVASARLIAHHVLMRQRQQQMLRHVHLIVRQWIVRVMPKIARLPISIVTRLRVVILQIVVSVVLLRVKIARQLVMALIVLHSMIVQIAVAVRLVTVIRVQLGAVMIAARRVVNTVTQRLRNVVNSHHVLSVVIVQSMTSYRFSAQPA